MPILHLLILALVQGITEFLPISSSAHLILAWNLFDAEGVQGLTQGSAQRLVIDVAVHVGTLGAVCVYFWRDLTGVAGGFFRMLGGGRGPMPRLAFSLIVATLPVVAVGFLAKDLIADELRDIEVIAWTTLIFGLLLYLGDKVGLTVRRLEHITAVQALFIGLAQVLALVPGTSRSGITMTAARLLGYERPEAARFSMLLSIPTILGAGTLAALDLAEAGDARLTADAFIAAGLSFVTALAAIALMMAWLKRFSFTPFVLYRLLLAAGLFWIVYGGG